jgi:hypothetical protein
MFMRRTMKNDIRFQPLEEEHHVVPVLQFPDHRYYGSPFPDSCILQAAELPFYAPDAVFAVAEDVQTFGAAIEELPGKFTSYAASGTGDQDPLPPDIGETLLQINEYRFPSQEVLGIQIPGLYKVRIGGGYLTDRGQYANSGEFRPPEGLKNLIKLFSGS